MLYCASFPQWEAGVFCAFGTKVPQSRRFSHNTAANFIFGRESHVQESIRQSAIQLFSKAFFGLKNWTERTLIGPDKIFGIVVKIVVKTK